MSEVVVTSDNGDFGEVKELPNEMIATINLADLQDYNNRVIGKVKTLIDASITDHAQRKAMKDLVVDAVWNDTYYPIARWAEAQQRGEFSTFPFRRDYDITPE